MKPSINSTIVNMYCQTHDRILMLAEKMSDHQLHWRPTGESHSIAFHLWHVARWADYVQAIFPGMTPDLLRQFGARDQLWVRTDLARQWQFSVAQLGYAQTGMTMPDEIARSLPFPAKDALLAYVRATFAAVEEAARAINEDQLAAAEQPQPLTEGIWAEGTVCSAIAQHLIHDNRHLGAIECLYGLQTGSGTATI